MLEPLAVLAHESRQNKGEGGGVVHGIKRRTAREEEEIHVGEHVRYLEIAKTVLHRTEELPRTTQTQILLGETEAIARLLDDLQPLLRCRAPARNQDAVGGMGARPTRPRSWCSWESPKRSACSTTRMLAFGTLTPTSMTVVETSSLTRFA